MFFFCFVFKNNSVRNTSKMYDNLDPDKASSFVSLILVAQTVFKCYQQMTPVGK